MVKAWRELVTIPTYEVGKPEKNPIFLEKRVYQGSSGVVYPYPVIESISDEKVDKEWLAVWLENEYIKVMILPQLGGRVQMAYDKVKQRHFVYYNHVIKPALVGLTGPWISGGIEFNWPQHHRPSTYLPVDCDIVENEDGSVTVWVNEMERMFHQKGMAGFTLRPGCAYLEIQGRVSNRTPLPQTFLWWANPAVEVNDAYQSVFPPDVNAVFDHGKRAVSSFPIATGTYYKMDYSAGVDISNYKNIYVPTSYMAVNSKYDFEGGYENDTKGGMLHVASHHFSPGKKQWTWGNGDFGRAWDRNLTDEAPLPSPRLAGGSDAQAPLPQPGETGRGLFRPYIELMAGVYTENQPDFAWLMPYEEKQFVQYFMPYREIGIVKQASKDFILNIESLTPSHTLMGEKNQVTFKVLATSKKTVRIILDGEAGKEYYNKVVTLSPEQVLVETVTTGKEQLSDLRLTIERAENPREFPLLEWFAEPDEIRPIPDAAEAALSPQDTKTIDQLYLTGLHLEQYRHATWSALDYYEEALRRDPLDYRCNMQMGLWYLRRARFEKAEPYLQTAVKVLKKRNPNPYDGEPLFYLGLVSKYRNKTETAYQYFWKSTWNKAWADAGYYEAACISISNERWEEALDELERSLISNSHNHQARAMKAAVLRKLGRQDEALAWISESYKIDHFNYLCMVEEHLLTDSTKPLEHMVELMHGNIYNYHEIALDYIHAGLYDEAILVLQTAIDHQVEESPLTYYYMAYASKISDSINYLQKAVETSPDYCFPNRLEDAHILKYSGLNPFVVDARAPYYLGCLYYDKRQYDLAVKYWERSAKLDPSYPAVWRNLALARFNKSEQKAESSVETKMDWAVDIMSELASQQAKGEEFKSPVREKTKSPQEEAVEYMERAFHLDETDSRILMELDQLYKRLHRPHQERLDFLQQYPQLIAQRDDLVLEEITLLNQLGRYEEAKAKLDAHQFHPWEGGEGKVPAQYQICRVELAKKSLTPNPSPRGEGYFKGEGSDYLRAIKLLQECLEYPHHLGEGKLYGAQENDFYYLLGVAYDALGEKDKARECWEEATKGPQEPAAAMYYNDAKPDKIFYQGMALLKLGREGEAHGRFYKLINYGKQHLFEKQVMDYFAVSLPDLLIWDDSLDTKNEIHCKYMLALGYYGMGDKAKAQKYLEEVAALDNNHQGIQQLKTLCL
jgi:tetratricopeptide (TPR) repeat protein